eukprot:gene29193-35232_t
MLSVYLVVLFLSIGARALRKSGKEYVPKSRQETVNSSVRAGFVKPRGIYGDDAGNLYIADPGSHTIWLLPEGDILRLSVYAGSKDGSLADGASGVNIGLDTGLWDVTGDTQGRIYYSEATACRIRVLSPIDAVVKTTVGIPFACYHSGDGGAASAGTLGNPHGITLDASRNVLYIAEYSSNAIRVVDMLSKTIRTLAAASQIAQNELGQVGMNMLNPVDVWTNDEGDVFMINNIGNCEVYVNSTGLIHRVSAVTNICMGIVVNEGATCALTSISGRRDGSFFVMALVNGTSGRAYYSADSFLSIVDDNNSLFETWDFHSSSTMGVSNGLWVTKSGYLLISDETYGCLWNISLSIAKIEKNVHLFRSLPLIEHSEIALKSVVQPTKKYSDLISRNNDRSNVNEEFVPASIIFQSEHHFTTLSVASWTIRASAVDNDWRSVVWSPERGQFVAVATNGAGNGVMTSSDGISWTAATSVPSNFWLSVCWSSQLGLYVAVAGSQGGVMTSPDGVTWTQSSSYPGSQSFGSVCWSPQLGLFVAVAYSGSGGRVMTSTDGFSWTDRSAASVRSWMSVCWSAERGIFVAVANGGGVERGLFVAVATNRVVTSPDGITWTSRTSAANSNWNSVSWSPDKGVFVAVAIGGTGSRIMTSLDGIVWTARTAPWDRK